MKGKLPDYNVFLSYAPEAAPTAKVFKRSLIEAGLRAYDVREDVTGVADVMESIRLALRESDAFVAVITPGTLAAPSMAVELGAAMALDKPIFLLSASDQPALLPPHMQRFQLFPASRASQLVATLIRESRPLSDADREVLKLAYARTSVPTDKLFFDAEGLDRLTSEFSRRTKTSVRGERLLRELVRLRKQGRLPRLRAPKASVPARRQIA